MQTVTVKTILFSTSILPVCGPQGVYNHALRPFRRLTKINRIFSIADSMQVTKGTWCMREQCVPGSLSSSPAQEPGNEATPFQKNYRFAGCVLISGCVDTKATKLEMVKLVCVHKHSLVREVWGHVPPGNFWNLDTLRLLLRPFLALKSDASRHWDDRYPHSIDQQPSRCHHTVLCKSTAHTVVPVHALLRLWLIKSEFGTYSIR